MILRSLFPHGVVMDHGWREDGAVSLYREEQACIRHAGPRRQREFAMGRFCARHALARMGIRGFPLVRGRQGQPLWPPGVVGSISHTDDYCVAAVAWQHVVQSLGVDIEKVQSLTASVRESICTPQESTWIEELPRSRRDWGTLLIFSAKECFFKCVQPLTGCWWEFKDLITTFSPTVSMFEVRTTIVPCPSTLRFLGRYHVNEKYVYTGMTAWNLRN